jgi:hypothetical protein
MFSACITNPAMMHSLQTGKSLKKGDIQITDAVGPISYTVKGYDTERDLNFGGLYIGLTYGVTDKFDLSLFTNIIETSFLVPSLTAKYNLHGNKEDFAVAIAPTYKVTGKSHSLTLPLINSYHLFNDHLSFYLTPQYQYINSVFNPSRQYENENVFGYLRENEKISHFFAKRHTHLLGYTIGTKIYIGLNKKIKYPPTNNFFLNYLALPLLLLKIKDIYLEYTDIYDVSSKNKINSVIFAINWGN